MARNSIERVLLYTVDGRVVRAALYIKRAYSSPTLDGDPAELIQRTVTALLEDGRFLYYVDDDTFETWTGERLSRTKPI